MQAEEFMNGLFVVDLLLLEFITFINLNEY